MFRSPTLGQATAGKGNKLRYANGEQYTYDDRDHLSQRTSDRGTVSYDYDSHDQLSVIFWEGANGKQWGWDAEHDALGRRIRKAPGYRDDTHFYWDGDRLMAELFHDGRVRVYVYADGFAVVPMLFIDYASVDAEPESGTRYYVITDQRSCPERVLDDEGAVVWKASVDPYGYARIEVGQEFHQPLRMPGHYFDAETGLHDNRFRVYDPVLCRYLQSDPWGLRGGFNVYAYTRNPLVQWDLRGLGCEGDGPTGSSDEPDAIPSEEPVVVPGELAHLGEGVDVAGLSIVDPRHIGAAEYPYDRVGWRAGTRELVYEGGRGEDGVVRSPSGNPIAAGVPFDIGHIESHASLERRAVAEGWSRERFIDESHRLDNLRPELRGDNRSHLYEPPDPGDLEF